MTAGYQSGYDKLDIAILPLSGTAETATASRPYDMSKYDKGMFIVSAGTAGSAASTSAIVWGRILQGLSTSTGTFVAVYSASSFTGFKMGTTNCDTISNAVAVIVDVGTSARTGETLVIWGKSSADAKTYTYSTTISSTGVAATTDYFLSASSADANIATKLAAMINDSTVGVTDLTATNTTTTTITVIRAKEAGEACVNIVASVTAPTSDGSARPMLAEQVGYLSFLGQDISVSSSYRYVMLELTPSTAMTLSAMLVRSAARYSPTQYVSGSKTGGAT